MNNNVIEGLIRKAGPQVTAAIQAASKKTGVDFAYLMEKAAAESSFKTDIKAKTSSATGLFQFIESTWLSMVKQHGHKYGMGDMAAQIDDKGRVRDPALRKEILDQRKDPELASFMAAEFAAGNQDYLQHNLRKDYGEIGATEMYFAHFMGAGGATAFLNALKENPLANAADLFPKAANANRNVFYDSRTGEARTLAGVYDFFDKKFGNGAPFSSSAGTLLAAQEQAVPGTTDKAANAYKNYGAFALRKGLTTAHPLQNSLRMLQASNEQQDAIMMQAALSPTSLMRLSGTDRTRDDQANALWAAKGQAPAGKGSQALHANATELMILAQLKAPGAHDVR